MDNKTVQYKRTLKGSVGAGVSALFNGNGRRYFILVHKDASKYHKAGESQKIIIDQVELGRDANCQVRFDDSFSTVSRHHAAIVKDGDRWKLVQLSKTNSTFLNGHPVDTEWYLENGDEIQLSVGGPRLGFIVPAGKQSLVSSIKMTERLELFRKQALKPYKTAIACLAVVLVLLAGGGSYVISEQDKSIVKLLSDSSMLRKMNENAKKENEKLAGRLDSLKKVERRAVTRTVVVGGDETLQKEINRVKSSVYALTTIVYLDCNGNVQVISRATGTGFLTADGMFVTARHCVEPWLFYPDLNKCYAVAQKSGGEAKIYAVVKAVNNQQSFEIRSDRFRVDDSYDTPCKVSVDLEGEHYELDSKLAFGSEKSLGNDWAFCRVGRKGVIRNGAAISGSLKSGTTVHMLGFPKSIGRGDGSKFVEPIYNKMSVSRDGLNNARCIMISQGVDHGNSGGPVFVMHNGQLQVIGIVSRGDFNSQFYNHLIPMCNLN